MPNLPPPRLPQQDAERALQQALEAGQWTDALNALQTLQNSNPQETRHAGTEEFLVHVLTGLHASEQGHPEDALLHFQAAARLAPDFYRIHNLLGNACLELGDYPRARESYARATRLNPRYAAGFCNLGSLALAEGDPREAIRQLNTALELQPDFSHALAVLVDALEYAGDIAGAIARIDRFTRANPPDADLLARRGGLLQKAGDIPGAIETYSRAAALDSPDKPAFLAMLSSLCEEIGQTARAMAWLDQALALLPDDPILNFRKGNLLLAENRPEAAVTHFRTAIRLKPEFPEACCNLGGALFAMGRVEDSLASYREAARLAPELPDAHSGISTALQALGRNDEALRAVETGLAMHPDHETMRVNRGVILQALGRYGESEVIFRTWLRHHPQDALIHNNLAASLLKQGRFAEAWEHAHAAVTLDAHAADYWLNLGAAEDFRGNTLQAVGCAREAARLAPSSAKAWNNLGYYTHKLGQPLEAIAHLEKAVALDPKDFLAWSNLLFCLCFSEAVSPEAYIAKAQAFGLQLTQSLNPPPAGLHPPVAEPPRFHIGLISGDFRAHPVSFFLESLIAHVDQHQFSLYAYNTHSTEADEVTRRLKSYIRHWRDVDDMPVERLADRIRADGIHILIDLSGHTAHNRLDVFVYRPAPIQVSWLGYLASTGLPQMDYFLADPVSAPPALQHQFREKIWHLPATINCFKPPADTPLLRVAPPPVLHKGHTTFGSFQRISKISDRTLALWGRVLSAVPGSRLRLPFRNLDNPEQMDALYRRFDHAGIDRRRLELQGSIPDRTAYLATHCEVDIILDTIHYQGITTTCEGLWMGVPTLTLAGDRVLSRQGASLLQAAGLPEWVAETEADYIAKAAYFAARPEYLADLRTRLREMATRSPIMDGAVFTRDMEKAWVDMWRRYCLEHDSR